MSRPLSQAGTLQNVAGRKNLDTYYAKHQAVPVATKAMPHFAADTQLSDGVIMGGTAKLDHVATRTASGIQLVFVNYYSNSSRVETPGLNNITVAAGVEQGTSVIPVTFNGQPSVVIPPGGTVISDVIGVYIVKGATFYTRTYVSVASGDKFPRGGHGAFASNYANPAGANLTGLGAGTLTGGSSVRVFAPAAIIGQPLDTGKAVVAIVGDSIGAGDNDSQRGFVERALGGNYSFQKVTYSGEGPIAWVDLDGTQRFRRVQLLHTVGVTHIISEHGVNSIGTTLATLQPLVIKYWNALAAIAPTWQTTVTPQTTSTDGWVTTGNQTPFSSNANRILFNNWLRDGAPMTVGTTTPAAVGATGGSIVRAGQTGHPLMGVLEIADLAETARDSGIWKAGYTTDGTHPGSAGTVPMSAGIPAATLFGPA